MVSLSICITGPFFKSGKVLYKKRVPDHHAFLKGLLLPYVTMKIVVHTESSYESFFNHYLILLHEEFRHKLHLLHFLLLNRRLEAPFYSVFGNCLFSRYGDRISPRGSKTAVTAVVVSVVVVLAATAAALIFKFSRAATATRA